MLCGTKRFVVTVESDSNLYTENVSARDQVMARKVARKKYGENSKIKTCKKVQTFVKK